jgi:hypothetical protein
MTDLQGLMRRRLLDEGHRQIVLSRNPDGRWQASLRRPSDNAFAVETASDPVEALRKVLGGARSDEDLIG